MELKSPVDNLFIHDDTYQGCLGAHYDIVLRSVNGKSPIPSGSILITLKAIGSDEIIIKRCAKHAAGGEHSVLQGHEENIRPITKGTEEKPIYGLVWKIPPSPLTEQRSVISFECTNHDISRLGVNRKWMIRIHCKGNNLF